jgi:DNA-binding transcriptional MocR family regulator
MQRVAEFAWLHMPGVEEFRRELVTRRALVVWALRAVGFAVDTDGGNSSSMFVWARLPEDNVASRPQTWQLLGVLRVDDTAQMALF